MNTILLPKKKKKNWILIIIMIILIIITCIIYKIYFETFLKNDIFITNNIQKMFIINDSISKVITYLNYGNSIVIICIIIIIVYNYSNIYKSFLLFTMTSFLYYISAWIKFFIQTYTPYYYKNIINEQEVTFNIYYCSFGFGFPSTQTFVMVPFYLCIWKIYSISKPKVNKSFKVFLFIIIFLLIICFSIATIISGSHYFSQVIFSFILGSFFYFIIFYGLKLDLQNGDELYKIIKNKIYFYILIYLFLYGPLVLTYFFLLGKDNNKIFDGCKIHNENKSQFLENEKGYQFYLKGSFIYTGIFIANFFCILGIKCELFFIFKDNKNNWIDFNFSKENLENENDNDDLNLTMTITITKDAKWNNTTSLKSLLRVISLFIFTIVSFSPYYFVSWNNNFYYIFLIKITLPIIIFNFGLFFLFKKIFSKNSCINHTIFITLDENQKKLIM